MDRDPAWPAWDSAELLVASDSARVARYRLHQSWYREHVLRVGPGEPHGNRAALVGNTLDPAAVRADPSLNFVNLAAYEAAIRRGTEVQAEGGTLEVGRLFHNLMSSMTMCFNLFGALGDEPAFTEIVRELFDPSATRIDSTICEITPTDALQDRTAFDAMIRYTDTSDIPRFIGIETKYTEPFSPTKYDNAHYRAATEASGWFVPGAADALVGARTNQLWRGLMLASLTEEVTGAEGRYVVVAPADDTTAAETVNAVRASLTDPNRLQMVTLEQIVNTAEDSESDDLKEWAKDFRERYLDIG